MALSIILGGALGRMGREVAACCEREGIAVACGVDINYSGQPMPFPMVKGYELVDKPADVIVDFTRPEGLPELLSLAMRQGLPVVLCTTGFSEAELQSIREASERVAILRSANMSLGVYVLRSLVAQAARALGGAYDIEIVERHHNQKVDAPSGTALMLYEAAKAERDAGTEAVFGRYGRAGKRKPSEIGIHAIRGGTVTGEHEVGFYGAGEEILLTHRAENRSLFAQGAVAAARFLHGRAPGLYGMQQVAEALMQ